MTAKVNTVNTNTETETYLTGRPIDYTKTVEGNPRRLFVEFEMHEDGTIQVANATGEVKVNQYATKYKTMRARSVHRVLRNAGIKRTLTVN